MPDQPRGLQINEDLTFQRSEWRIQRTGWFALCAFNAAALLGLFGGGPLSHARAGEPGSPIWVEYERFVRQGAAERVVIHLAPVPDARDALEVRMSRSYFDRFDLERVNPEPDAMEVGATDVVLRFSGEAARSSSIVLRIEPVAIGRRTGTITGPGAAPVTVTQYVYF